MTCHYNIAFKNGRLIIIVFIIIRFSSTLLIIKIIISSAIINIFSAELFTELFPPWNFLELSILLKALTINYSCSSRKKSFA